MNAETRVRRRVGRPVGRPVGRSLKQAGRAALAGAAALLMIGMIGASAQAADPSLVAWYTFDGDAQDSSGNDYHGTVVDTPTWEAGFLGTGSAGCRTGYIQMPDIRSEFTDQATLSLWIKMDSAVGSGQSPFHFESGSCHYVWSDGQFYVGAFRSGQVAFTPPATPDRATWHHMAITHAPGAGNWKVYLNGTEVYSADGEASISLPAICRIGHSWTYAFGDLDDVRVYNRALTQPDIQALFDVASNAAPTVSITSPAAGAGFATTDDITITADASDDGTVTGVEFFVYSDNTIAATGGDNVYDYTDAGTTYRVHEFTTVGTSSFVVTNPATVEYLVVGGGGGGGGTWQGGGGGAGGFLTGTTGVTAQSYTVVVGAGGAGRNTTGGNDAENGEDSSFSAVVTTAIGGGRGAGEGQEATGGGSGGGGCHYSEPYKWGGAGTPGQGFKGGDTTTTAGAGGGGAGGAGADNTGSMIVSGGPGLPSSITGAAVTYAAGGVGRGRYSPTVNGSDGAANTGNGGEGGGGNPSSGGNGGSGIVVIRYFLPTSIGAGTGGPDTWTVTWPAPHDEGEYVLTAVATDNDSAQTTSAPVNVVVGSVVTITATANAAEPSTDGVFTITRSGDTTGVTTVEFAVNVGDSDAVEGTDFDLNPAASVTFLATETTKTIAVEVMDDGTYEPDETVVVDLGTITGGVAGTPSSATVTITDDDPHVYVEPTGVPTPLVTTEALGQATFEVWLHCPPETGETVTITLASDTPAEGTVLPASLVFNGTNYGDKVTVTVTGADDDVDDGDVLYTVTTDASSSGTKYHNLPVDDVAMKNLDDDTAGMVVTPTSGLVTSEDETPDTFTVRLASEPVGTVDIDFSTSDTTEGQVTSGAISFDSTNWGTEQTVTVTGQDDGAKDGSIAYDITVGPPTSGTDPIYPTLAAVTVSCVNADNEATVTVTPTSGLVTTEAGGEATFTVALAIDPGGTVTINVTTSDTSEGVVVGVVDYLVVAGGGGGGGSYEGGGAGAGGFLAGKTKVTAQSYTVVVGPGGVGCIGGTEGYYPPDARVAENGEASSFSAVGTTAVGGGRGASEQPGAGPGVGGSGGGGESGGGAAGTPGQGYEGGDGNSSSGGGGGGAGGPGTDNDGSMPTAPGGPGISSNITGSDVVYAAGGLGRYRSANTDGSDAAASTGNGGDGGAGGLYNGGDGGSGIVVIRYVLTPSIVATGGTVSEYSDAGVTYRVHKFTTSGTFDVTSATNVVTLTFDSTNYAVPQTVTVTGVDDTMWDGNIFYDVILQPITGSGTDYDTYDPDDVVLMNQDDETEAPDGVTADLVVWYKFEGDAQDSSGNDYHGTLIGTPDWEAGWFGTGSVGCRTGWIELPDISSQFTNQATLSLWIKMDSADAHDQPIFHFGVDGATSTHYVHASGAYFKAFRNDRISFVPPATPDRATWHHMAVTNEPGAGNWKFYLNGTEVYSTTGEDTITLPANCLIGAGPGGYGQGNFDDVRVYNRALTPEEVDALFSGSRPLPHDDYYTTPLNTPLTVISVANGVLANDTDPDGNYLIAALSVDAANGGATVNPNGTFTYTPDTGFTGVDSFAYSASDGTRSASATVYISVGLQAPVAMDDFVTAYEDIAVEIDVLANDSNPEGDGLRFASYQQPGNGTVTYDAATQFLTYTPDAGWTGTDAFTYSIRDDTGALDQATVTVTVNPAGSGLRVVTIAATTSAASETGPVSGEFTVSRAYPGGPPCTYADLTVNLSVSGSAKPVDDYTALPASVMIPDGSSSVTISVDPLPDALAEGNETVTVGIAPGAYTVGAPGSATVTIADDDTPEVTITASVPDAVEGSTWGEFTVTRTGEADGDLEVTVKLEVDVSSTAAAPADYSLSGATYNPVGPTVTIPQGALSAVVAVAPADDSVAEIAETVKLNLLADAAYTLTASPTATVTIADDDLPEVTVTASVSAAGEPADDGEFTVALAGSLASDFTVDVSFAVSGSATRDEDYELWAGGAHVPLGTDVVTTAPGASSVVVTVVVLDDMEGEGDEDVLLTVTAGAGYVVGAGASAEIIIEDDEPAVTVVAETATVSEDETVAYGVFKVTRAVRFDARKDEDLDVDFSAGGDATVGTDYELYMAGGVTPLGTSFTMPSGDLTVEIEVRPIDDALGEGDETVTLTLVPLAGSLNYFVDSPSSDTVTIEDDEPGVMIAASDPNAAEPPSPGAFTVTLTKLWPTPVTVYYVVSGSATPGADYAALPGSVDVPADPLFSATIQVVPTDDNKLEPSETVVVTLEHVDDDPAYVYYVVPPESATVTIEDDERGGIAGGLGCAPGPAGRAGPGPGAAWALVLAALLALAARAAACRARTHALRGRTSDVMTGG